MKLLTIAFGFGLVATTSVSAAPYYVGEKLNQSNNITLGFWDTPTKKDAANGRADTGNIAAFNLDGVYLPSDNISLNAGFPFYMATKKATSTGTSRSALGNISLGAGWTQSMTSSDNVWTYGYSLSADVYTPTSRKSEGSEVAQANPSTDFYRFSTKAVSTVPSVGLFVSRDMFSLKTNLGYGYIYQTGSNISDRNRNTAIWQTAASWHALPNLHVNLEYNTIGSDTTTRGTTISKFAQSITPSLSGNYESILGQAFVTVPVDSKSRDYTNVAFGLNTGYMF